MKTLNLILDTLQAFDCVKEVFVVEQSTLVTNDDGKIAAIEFVGTSESLPFGGTLRFQVEIEDGDTMDPSEITARVQQYFQPDSDSSNG